MNRNNMRSLMKFALDSVLDILRDRKNYINPFDTKPMAKIAVKMSIIRVVKFMSS